MIQWWLAAVVLLGVTCLAESQKCGGTFLEEAGTITSPGYPNEYPHNTDCVYTILADEDARIKLSCPDIHLQDSEGCQSDSLRINKLHLCGKTQLDEVYGQGSITLQFTSDGSFSNRGGFKCTYERVSGGEYRGYPHRSDCVPTTTVTTGTTSTASTFSSCNTEYDYKEVLRKSLLFYEAQRSGFLPPSQRVTWRRDSATDDAKDAETNQRVDLEGGYYDAGDYMKFGFPMASAATVLAWGGVDYPEAYMAAGEMINLHAAVKWATDYFLKAHVDKTTFYGQVGNGEVSNEYWGRPEDMTMPRPAYKITESRPGSDLAGETAAALAAASILFKDADPTYSAECLLHARQLYDFADKFRGKYSDSIVNAANYYNSWGNYYDELAWAAMWLYRATGEDTYLSQAKTHYSNIDPNSVNEFSWAEKTPGAMVLLAQLADAADKPTYADHLEKFCDRIINDRPRTPKGLVFIGQWAPLRYAANVAFVCLRAADLGIKSETYKDFGKQQIHYMLGSTGRSFVVGFGNNPPQRPHHASSSCKDPPEPCSWPDYHSTEPNPHILYGALVGGPDINDVYEDVRSDYVKNEVACDYNAGFQSAVAALQDLYGCGSTELTSTTVKTTVSITSATSTTQEPVQTTLEPEISTAETLTTVKTTPTPTSPPPTTTLAPVTTTTETVTAECAQLIQTNEWRGNFQANVVVIIPFSTRSWDIVLTFSRTITRFRVWTADPSPTPSNTITLTNKSYNGWQTAGNTLSINFIASYKGKKPQLTAITFNGTPLCLN